MRRETAFKFINFSYLLPFILSAFSPSSASAQVVALSCSNAEREVQLVLDYNKKEAFEYYASGKMKSPIYDLQIYPDDMLLTAGTRNTEFLYVWRVDRYSLDAEFEKSSNSVPIQTIKCRCSKVPLGVVVRGRERQI